MAITRYSLSRVIKQLALIIFLIYCFSAFFLEFKAKAQPVCIIDQITDTPGGSNSRPSISSDGSRIAFDTALNITGGNLDGNREIFLFDTNTMMFTQITDTMGASNNDAVISSDGTSIVFDSTNDIVGENPEEVSELYLFDTNAMMFTQITDTEGEGLDSANLSPTINSDGTRIAFETDNDLTGDNTDGNHEIFLFNTNTAATTQITDTTTGFGSANPSINSDGIMIAFQSSQDITGSNADGNLEIFLFNSNTVTFSEITDTMGELNVSPVVNSDVSKIAFNSTADITGNNLDENSEIFLFDTNSAMFTQITDTTGEGNFANTNTRISSDGTRIAFLSNRDLTGDNPDGNDEIILFDTDIMTFTQITDTAGDDNFSPTINSDGSRIAFQSNHDLIGDNPEGNFEIFLARCFDGIIPGDANGDGDINILDVTALLNDILEISPAAGNGDCNEDLVVNILDVTCVLNIILGG
ncbi:MAG: hypothetical protein WBD99_14700 [Thermodesulfobacteriota bacterium]